MSRFRRLHSSLLTIGLAFAVFAGPGNAAAPRVTDVPYPVRPIRIIVPAAAGGGTDILARIFGAKLTEVWGQPVVVDNRSGGAQTIGTDLVAKALPDGYTLLFNTSTHAVNPSLFQKLPYDSIRDFAPITQLASAPNLFVAHPSVPVRTLNEFIALAKGKPGQMNYGSSGNGSTGHLAMEMLKSIAGINLLHIPYKGAAPVLNAILAGEVSVLINQILVTAPQVKAGRLKALAVTSNRRSLVIPDVPTIAEAGVPGFQANGWFGALAPRGTPSAIVDKLNSEFVRILKLPEIHERLAAEGAEPIGNSPEEYAAIIRADVARWDKVIKRLDIVPQ